MPDTRPGYRWLAWAAAKALALAALLVVAVSPGASQEDEAVTPPCDGYVVASGVLSASDHEIDAVDVRSFVVGVTTVSQPASPDPRWHHARVLRDAPVDLVLRPREARRVDQLRRKKED